MTKHFDVMYVNEDFKLMQFECYAKDIMEVTVKKIPDEIPMKSIICIKGSSWDDLI